MSDPKLPTLDELLGPQKAENLPTLDELLGGNQPSGSSYGNGPEFDSYMNSTAMGRVLNLFGQGAQQAYGTLTKRIGEAGKEAYGPEPTGFSQETEDKLKKAGIFRTMEDDKYNIGKAFNEAWMRPAAAALDATIRGGRAAFAGTQELVKQALGGGQFGQDIAALPEVFPMGHLTGAPSMPPTPQALALAKARSLRIIGEGEAGWKGTVDPTPATDEGAIQAARIEHAAITQQEPLPGQPPAEEMPTQPGQQEPPPDIHTVARQIAPDTFHEFDALSQRQETFRRWLDELRQTQIEKATAEAPHAEEIADLNVRMADATPRLQKKYAARLETLNQERADYIEEQSRAETADMQKVRQAFLKNNYRMRDMAPDVSAAYRQAQDMMPKPAVAAEVPVAPPEAPPPPVEAPPPVQEAPQPVEAQAEAPAAPVEAPKPIVNIADDIAQKLVAAGRPQEEADASAALVAAHYETRAGRLGTTAQDLYEKEGPTIEAAAKGRVGETGRTILKNGRATIRLMQGADASTFIHETGHVWADELLRDAADERALPEVKGDAITVRNWLGAKEDAPLTRAQHERFAKGFEQYIMEGRAPSQQLASVFQKFKDWLSQIYQKVSQLGRPINDDIRHVFDRLITPGARDTVIAPEREAGKTFADIHEADAEATPPEKASGVADQIRQEADQVAQQHAPEVLDELTGRGAEATGGETEGGGADRNESPPRPVPRQAGPPQEPGTVGEGGGKAAQEGGGVRTATKPPIGANTVYPEPESRLLDKAGNIRLDNLGTPEDVNQALREMAERNNEFMGARRGVVSDADVLALADAMGVDAKEINLEKLRAMSVNDPLPLGVRIRVGRQMLVQAGTAFRDASLKAATGSDADVMAFAGAADRLIMIQETVSGITAEMGRGLRAFRAIPEAKDAEALAQFAKETKGLTLFQMRQMAQKASRLETAAQMNKFARDIAKPGVFDWLQSVFINALISGPFTHAGYTAAGEVYGLFRATAEVGASALVGKLREIAGLGPKEYAEMGEMPNQLYGMYRGARNGARASWQALKANVPVLPEEVQQLVAKEAKEKGIEPSVAGQSVNPRSVIPNPTIAGTKIPIGTVLESPGRMVTALHTFNWTTFYSQSIAGQAFRMARAENLTGQALIDRIAQLTQSPNETMIKEGMADANGGALLQRPGYNTLMGRFAQLTNLGWKVPDVPLPGGASIPMGTLRPLKFIDPFVQIQANLQRAAFIRGTPLSMFSQAVRDDLSFKNGGVAFDRTAGKMLAGTSFMIAAGGLAAEGLMNPSGPTDPAQSREWQRIHGQPHGLSVGNMSYNMLRFGALGLQMSVAADLHHFISQIGRDDASKVASELVHAFSQNIIDESSMRGIADVVKAVDEHDRYGAAWVRNFISSAMPFSVGLSQVAHMIDPYSRQARTTMDAIIAKLPVLSEGLLPRYDVWGQPVPSTGWLGTYRRPIVGDKVDEVLYGLGIYPTYPERRLRGVQLSDQQYNDLVRSSGQLAHTRLQALVSNPGFTTLPAQIQHDMIKGTIDESRKTADALILMQNRSIIRQAMQNKLAPLSTSGKSAAP